jgi:hypothetical protein
MPGASGRNFYHTVLSTGYRAMLITPDPANGFAPSSGGLEFDENEIFERASPALRAGKKERREKKWHAFQGFETPGYQPAPSGRSPGRCLSTARPVSYGTQSG